MVIPSEAIDYLKFVYEHDKPLFKKNVKIEKNVSKSEMFDCCSYLFVIPIILFALGALLLYYHPWSSFILPEIYKNFSKLCIGLSSLCVLGSLCSAVKAHLLLIDYKKLNVLDKTLVDHGFFRIQKESGEK